MQGADDAAGHTQDGHAGIFCFEQAAKAIIVAISVDGCKGTEEPGQEVYDYLKFLNNMKYYNKWVMADPNAKMTTKGTDGTVGFISAWDSENKQVGKGEEEIIKLVDGESIDFEINEEFLSEENEIHQIEAIDMNN